MYSIGEFAKLVHRTVRTLQQWDYDGKLTAYRTPTNRRYYTHDQYLEYIGIKAKEESKTVVYLRVSSPSQKNDLKNQRKSLEEFCKNSGIAINEWYQDIGSALNYKRLQFAKLLEEVEQGKVKIIVIAHKDRLVRFGFEWVEEFCVRHGAKIITMENETLSPEQEIVKDILTILHVFSCRIYGLRKYKDEISKEVQNKATKKNKKKALPRGRTM
jgi:predicted site-specific integrase-resolvase